jgi:hypothetical protein
MFSWHLNARNVLENENQERYLLHGPSPQMLHTVPLSVRGFHPGSSPRASALLGALFSVALMGGCASRATVPSTSASAADAPRVTIGLTELASPGDLLSGLASERIAAIHRSKCGSCHAPVEPGSLQRETAETAMQRHRRRARLSERDWAGMVDFLSADGTLHARHTAGNP